MIRTVALAVLAAPRPAAAATGVGAVPSAAPRRIALDIATTTVS